MRAALLNICLVAVGVGILKMLIPVNSFDKQINFLISCFFIASIIFSFSNEHIDFKSMAGEINSKPYVDFTASLTNDRKNAIATELSERVREVLVNNQISPKKIYVIVNISGLHSISINEIKLVLSEYDDFQRASDIVTEEVGSDIKVSIEFE